MIVRIWYVMISDYIPFVNQHDINIIKQQFTCLLRTIGKYVEQLSFARCASLVAPVAGQLAQHFKYYYQNIQSPLSLSLSHNALV